VIFESPRWLLALLALPVAALLEAWLVRRDREKLAGLVARPLWDRVVRRPSERWRFVRLTLVFLGTALVVVALARPQWGIVREKVEREGVDVVFVLDTSGSMATPDVSPNRFFLARQALLQLMSRLGGDRFALVAFEGEAYPLVPLTLDADAVGLFLETVEPGIVPAPGTSLGVGLAKGLDAFVDKERRNKVMVLVSDGENLEGDIEEAVRRAREAGVIVHTVAVGTEAGQPVPDFDSQGRQVGYKRDASGAPVVSRVNTANLAEIAGKTGGQTFRITSADTALSGLASAIEGMERKALAQEWTYRRRERFQGPLALGLALLAVGLLLPLPRRRAAGAQGGVSRRRSAAGVLVAALACSGATLLSPSPAAGQSGPSPAAPPVVPQGSAVPPAPAAQEGTAGRLLDEILLRPHRLTRAGRGEYEKGNHPQALESFEGAARTRPQDPVARFNVADGLYKTGKYDEAATLFRALGADPSSPLAAAARFNLGNSLYQKKDYEGAVKAYRDALRVAPDDEETRRNLELALRNLQEQKKKQEQQQQEQQQQEQQQKNDQKRGDDKKPQQGQDEKKEGQPGQPKPEKGQEQKENGRQQNAQGKQGSPPRPMTPEEREAQRFREETGMPKERAMQLLDALQQNEKAEQKRLLELERAKKSKGKDW
jgi:Ca-activated chloride channel family protein